MDPHDDNSSDQRGRDAETPSDIPASGWKDIAVRAKEEIDEDHTVLAAAGVAFFAFLAMIPALAALVSIAGLVTSPENASNRIEDLMGGLPSEVKNLLATQLESLASSSSGSLTAGLIVSLALSLWSAAGGMGHLMEGVNVAYDEHDDRGFVLKKAIALALTIGAIVFIVVAVVGLAALPSLLGATGLPSGARIAVQVAFWPLLVLGFAACLTVLYRYGPDRDKPEWRWVTWGSVIAVAVWILAAIAFRIYTATFGSLGDSYGSLSAVAVLLLFLFLTSFAVLLGAHVNFDIERQTVHDTTEGPDDPLGTRDASGADTVGRTADEPSTEERRNDAQPDRSAVPTEGHDDRR